MPDEDNKILKYNHGEKSMRVPFIIYVYLKKCTRAKIILKNFTWKKKYTPSGYSWFTNDTTTKNLILTEGKYV